MIEEVSENELQILEEMARIREISPWGAWVGVVLGRLVSKKLITKKFGGKITDKGWKVLNSKGHVIVIKEENKQDFDLEGNEQCQ